jgi:hypothetical protein
MYHAGRHRSVHGAAPREPTWPLRANSGEEVTGLVTLTTSCSILDTLALKATLHSNTMSAYPIRSRRAAVLKAASTMRRALTSGLRRNICPALVSSRGIKPDRLDKCGAFVGRVRDVRSESKRRGIPDYPVDPRRICQQGYLADQDLVHWGWRRMSRPRGA